MNLKATIPTAILAGIMVLSIFACCSVASAEATPPSWEEGDAWAMGFAKDLGAEYADEILDLEEELGNLTETMGLEVDKFDADGNVEFYLVFEVTEDTGTYYTLTADMGQKLLFSLDVEVTGDMPKEGTYDFESEPEMEEKTISADITLKYALWTHADVQVDKSTMAIQSIDLEVHGSVVIDASVQNFPNEQNEGEETTMSYESMDVWMSVDVNIEISIDFEPALDVFQFPFNVGDEWHVESNATISGSVDGFIDATGLPPEAEDQIFSEDFLVANGVNGFPIELDQLVNDEGDGPQITNGQLEEITENIEFDVACVGSEMVTVPNYGMVNVYTLEVDGEKFYYSPDVKFMTSMDVDFEQLFGESGMDIPVDIPEGLMEDGNDTLGSLDASVAKTNIQEIADYQGSISEEAEDGPSTGDDINDFFFKEPYFGIIIVVLVVVVVISVVFAAVRKK
jgi:hypothetical protein